MAKFEAWIDVVISYEIEADDLNEAAHILEEAVYEIRTTELNGSPEIIDWGIE